MIIKRDVDAFSTDGAAKSISSSWAYGDWQAGTDEHDTTLSLSFDLGGSGVTELQARVQLSHDGGTTTRGDAQVINFVSGGVIDVDDAVWDLPVDVDNNHLFEAGVRAGYAWRVGFKCNSGATSPTMLATAEVTTL